MAPPLQRKGLRENRAHYARYRAQLEYELIKKATDPDEDAGDFADVCGLIADLGDKKCPRDLAQKIREIARAPDARNVYMAVSREGLAEYFALDKNPVLAQALMAPARLDRVAVVVIYGGRVEVYYTPANVIREVRGGRC